MATHLEKLTDDVFLYVWRGEVTLEDIRDGMDPDLYHARRVVFDLSRVEYHPSHLSRVGTHAHRTLDNLEHVYVVYKPRLKAYAEDLVKNTLNAPYSLHQTREEATKLALED